MNYRYLLLLNFRFLTRLSLQASKDVQMCRARSMRRRSQATVCTACGSHLLFKIRRSSRPPVLRTSLVLEVLQLFPVFRCHGARQNQ